MLHWTIAALILFNLSLGFFMEGLPGALRGTIISLHISSGITVLVLTIARVLWRLGHKPPPPTADTSRGEHYAASLVHLCLYAGMVLMPLTGWALISANPPPGSPGAAAAAAQHSPAAGHPARTPRRGPRLIWGLVPLPPIATLARIGESEAGVPIQRAIHDDLVSSHSLGGYLLIGLLLLHVAGAARHQLAGQAELQRMGLGRMRRRGVEPPRR